MWTLIRHPILAARVYIRIQQYVRMCAALGYSEQVALSAFHRHLDEADPYAAAWAWLAAE